MSELREPARMYVVCQTCQDHPSDFPVAGQTESNEAHVGENLAHHAMLHDEDATVEFLVSVTT